MASTARRRYLPQEIESKWQRTWREHGVLRADDASDRPKYYDLVMYPYPSGELHMGHMRNYIMGDLVARFMRMRGYEVLHPFGWDAFGLPAENAAMQEGAHPAAWTKLNIAAAKPQLPATAFSALGAGNNVIWCDPDRDVVAVLRWIDKAALDGFLLRLVAALRD